MTTMVLRLGGRAGVGRPGPACDRRKMDVLIVSEGLIEQARVVEAGPHSLHTDVVAFSCASSAEQQLGQLKKMAARYFDKSDQPKSEVDQYFIKLLVEIYILAEPKHPLKCAVTRMLQSAGPAREEAVMSLLTSRLLEVVSAAGQQEELSARNTAVNNVSSCFIDFMLPVNYVVVCLSRVVTFLKDCLDVYIVSLKLGPSPVRKMELCQHIHYASRAVVVVLQKCNKGSSPQDTMVAVSKIACGQHDAEDEGIRNVLSQIFQSASFLISYQDIPMDTKTNCGLMMVLLTGFLEGDNGWIQLLQQCTGPCQGHCNTDSSLNLTSDVSQLCLFSGFLSALSFDKLSQSALSSSSSVLEVLFRHFLAIGARNTSESNVVLAVCRCLQLLTRCLCNAVQHCGGKQQSVHSTCPPGQQEHSHVSADLVQSIMSAILDDALQFVWTHLEHYMDGVRHVVKGMLCNLVQVAALLRDTASLGGSILETITTATIGIPAYRKCRFVALSTLAGEVGCHYLLSRMPGLVSDLLTALTDPGLTSHAASAFEMVMLKHKEECPLEEWQAMWVTPLLSALDCSTSGVLTALEDILAKVMRYCPSVVDYVLPTVCEPVLSCDRLRTVLACLKVSRRQGYLESRDEMSSSKWKGILEYNILEKALCHMQDEIRMSALTLLADSHRSTEPFLPAELQLIRIFLKHNINTQVPAARQQALALLKKILVRMKDSSLPLLRNNSATSSDQLRSYATFQMWLVEFCFTNLFPGANFQRRGSALQLLTLVVDIFGAQLSSCIWTASNAETLIECLKDTYENNKLLTLRLLLHFPPEALRLDDGGYVSSLITACLQLASSNRPPDCITAAYLLRCLVGFQQSAVICIFVQQKIQQIQNIHFSPDEVPEGLVFGVISLLKHQLEGELAVAKLSLLHAAASAPMYGSLFCIRQLLQDVDLRCVSQSAEWQQLISELITLCFELNATVSTVVNSSSPEGHLPMDLQSGAEYLRDLKISDGPAEPPKDESGSSPARVLSVTAQMLLLCSWRTVKEVSLFLGEISERAPVGIKCGKEEGLVKEEQLLMIGDHLTTLLAETKHRGAFEQAYVGFCRLCTRLWHYPEGALHHLPAQWLQDLLHAIESGTGTKLCATRRSAGVPFMVQALVTTELQVGDSLQCFQKSMSTLLKLARTGNMVEARMHALNILRALYRHTQLGEMVTPYVADGVMAAIHGFKGNTWAERNSATLLFSSLMTRIFGVARSRDKLNIRNRMTGRIFFLRYPALFDFLLQELLVSTGDLAVNSGSLGHQPSLFPVLLILARLYPSSLEGTDSSIQLSEYIPYVEACARCAIMKTRILAARAIVPLITPVMYPGHLERLFSVVSHQKPVNGNYKQGTLLQILHLLYELPTILEGNKELKGKFESWILMSMWILHPCELHERCYATAETYLQVLQRFISADLSAVSNTTWQEVKDLLNQDLTLHAADHYVGRSIYELRAAQVFINLSIGLLEPQNVDKVCKEVEHLVLNFLGHPSYEVVLVVLNFLLALFEENEGIVNTDDEFDVIVIELNSIVRMSQERKEIVRNCLKKSSRVSDALVKTVQVQSTYSGCCKKAFQILYYIPEALLRGISSGTADDVLKWLLEECTEQHESIGCVVLKCAAAFADWLLRGNSQMTVTQPQVTDQLCQVLLDFSMAEKSLESRATVACILSDNGRLLDVDPTSLLSAPNVCTLWTAVMMLLDDDDLEVRNTIAGLTRWFLPGLGMPVVAHRARELLIETFVQIMHQHSPVLCVATLLTWSLREVDDDLPDSSISEDRVFNKGEMNIYAEDVVLTEVACQQLGEVVKISPDVLSAPVFEEVRQWLERQYQSSRPDISVQGFSTLKDFVKLATNKVHADKSYDRVSHFFSPDQKSIFVANYKMLRVLQAVPMIQ